MNDLPVSVVIVSRGRPQSLTRTLTGISQLQYWNFEVVVVADPDGIAAAETLPFASDLKLVPFDQPNISAARNLGLTHAAGEVIAFIDDDAVPEPMWLCHLIAPATRADVAAMGGYVRGRNGISFQWTSASLDETGRPQALALDGQQAAVMTPPKGRAIKTEGTNMAFRRDVLIELGGFDPAFHYFLDETDLNMRLARVGHATALVPLAEVHHGYAENRMRTASRVPTDLFDIGASWAVFHRKHVPEADRERLWQGLRLEQRHRLLRLMQSGHLEPRDIRRLMKRLDLGHADGLTRSLASPDLPKHALKPFLPFPSVARESIMILSRPARARQDRARAEAQVAAGRIVTLLILSPTAMFHQLGFDAQGFWVQKGGLFGKVNRNEPTIRILTRRKKRERETARVASQRGFGHERTK
ncbi:glycosyltransferase family 2 protein [Roseobacter sp. GAI101]|uniref:glycosyltransferase family 2 protein n=1 Tax=Roseobacter sp. (strain GAI101) TaxID=391589 RepID=UPI0001871512|nr:glycosyltransferase family 2 protein [Roseobacter sp. GAI101]EEB85901.1 glycosyl transferase, family 2 [Roseobacter sp. GAI101]